MLAECCEPFYKIHSWHKSETSKANMERDTPCGSWQRENAIKCNQLQRKWVLLHLPQATSCKLSANAASEDYSCQWHSISSRSSSSSNSMCHMPLAWHKLKRNNNVSELMRSICRGMEVWGTVHGARRDGHIAAAQHAKCPYECRQACSLDKSITDNLLKTAIISHLTAAYCPFR